MCRLGKSRQPTIPLERVPARYTGAPPPRAQLHSPTPNRRRYTPAPGDPAASWWPLRLGHHCTDAAGRRQTLGPFAHLGGMQATHLATRAQVRLPVGRHAGRSLVVRPHAQHSNDPLLDENLIHHAVLNIDATRVSAREVADQLFVRRRVLKWIAANDGEQFLCPRLEPAGGKFLCIFKCLLGKHDFPAHHFNVFALFASGSALPALMDSRIPGTASRYKVS